MKDTNQPEMKNKKSLYALTALIFLTIVQLSGCADTDTLSRNQEPSSTGMQGRSMRQGPPPGDRGNMGNMRNDRAEEEFSDEAFAVCEGKQVGDNVMLTNSRNEQVKAICKEYHDHLVAVPEITTDTSHHR